MASIHVIYDPGDLLRHPRDEELRKNKWSYVAMALSTDDIDVAPVEVAAIAKSLAEQLLAKVRGK